MPLIEPGQHAPPFSLPDQSGRTHASADHAGRALVLYFYPKDDTEACTRQACDFTTAMPGFSNLGAAVLAVSILNVRSKARFARKHGIVIPLLADEEHAVSERYGVWQEKQLFGRLYMGIVRTTYLIDGSGVVVRRWDAVKVEGHAQDVESAVRELGAAQR